MKPLTSDTLLAKILVRLTNAVLRYRWLFVYPQVVLAALCVLYTVRNLQFDISRDNLVGSDKPYHRNFQKFKKEFPTQDDLVVVVQSENSEKNRQFVERLGAKLEAETNLFHDVMYKGDLKMLGPKALLFVPETNLVGLQSTLQDFKPFVEQFTHTTNLVSLFSMVNTGFRTAKREKNAETDSLIKALPALERIVSEAKDSLRRPGTPPSPGVMTLFNPGEEAEEGMYITFPNSGIYLVTAQAPTEDKNGPALERLRVLVDQTKTEVPGLNVGITGEPVLEHDEMEQSQKDTLVASVASLVICALIFIYGYQETGRPIKATMCLLVGMAYTLAFATLTVGHLNILTITFAPILIGLAIDYGVHLISRYEEELRHGKSREGALSKAMVYTGQGILTGALTTAGAFLAMVLTDFKGIQEMGIICGGGLLICFIPMMTMLPVLLLKGRQNVIDHQQVALEERRARIERFWLERPVMVSVVTAVLCLLALTQIRKVYFDYDLRNMQSEGLPAVVFEKKLLSSTPKSVLYGAVIATNLDEAVTLARELKQLPTVASVESTVVDILTEDQTNKLKLIHEIKQELAPIQFQEPDRRPVDISELSLTLYSFYGYLGATLDAIGDDEPDLRKVVSSLRSAVEALRKQMLDGTPMQVQSNAVRLASFQVALFDDLRETFEMLKHQDDSSPMRVQDLPPELQDRFIGRHGKLLLMVYPKEDVWLRQNQKKFIEEVSRVYPDVTGTPVQLYHYTELLKQSYEEAARYSLVAIAILVFVHFRSPVSVALSLIPVGVGFLWLGGLMGWLGIPLNPANIMTLPLVIGIGVTNGIHILNRFAEEQTPGILARSTGKAVLVSGLTAIAGFGSLMLAQHRGIRSLGQVMSAGLATCMIAGLTFLPALLNLLTRKNIIKTERPGGENARSTTRSGGTEVKTSSLTKE
jgi:hopanoid biosynthesis associated RND transporter like protein HpnN